MAVLPELHWPDVIVRPLFNYFVMYEYVTNCTESGSGPDVSKMVDKATEIKYSTFARFVNIRVLEMMLGYTSMKIKNDYHVRYFSSRYQGKKCVYVVWSAQEWIFQK